MCAPSLARGVNYHLKNIINVIFYEQDAQSDVVSLRTFQLPTELLCKTCFGRHCEPVVSIGVASRAGRKQSCPVSPGSVYPNNYPYDRSAIQW